VDENQCSPDLLIPENFPEVHLGKLFSVQMAHKADPINATMSYYYSPEMHTAVASRAEQVEVGGRHREGASTPSKSQIALAASGSRLKPAAMAAPRSTGVHVDSL
jgi:hypothetical protein